jgi:Tfp pilus assembly pilus retraction ATPase PilT
MDITELLAFSAKQNASDLHLSAGLPPMIRVDGDVRRINLPPLEHKQVHEMLYDIMNDKQRKDFERCPALPVSASTSSTRTGAPAGSSGRFPPASCPWRTSAWARSSATSA